MTASAGHHDPGRQHPRWTAATVCAGAVLLSLVAAACEAPTPPAPAATPTPAPTADPLPGAAAVDTDLGARLYAAATIVDAETPPRTRHRRADGRPRYTNRLILESSPYLLQHAHNPVDWYPWGDEAFARALAERRPVFLSVGYSTCHWCHVMEEESFEDEEIAAYLNAHYVAIKVDREARPDIDGTYMQAVLTLTGGGGWPMTVWLTPGRQPFYGTTYLPPRDGERGMPQGLLTVLRELRAAFDENPLRVAQQAAAVTERVRARAVSPPGEALPGVEVLRRAVAEYTATFDAEHGGFGGAPKFPAPAALQFLLRYHRRSGDERVLAMVTRTLAAMAAGGIYDHVGGGFHRYATDAAWQVPHFEKILADNAQLAAAYLDAYQVTRDDDFGRVTREILDYVAREMTAPNGGFYTASDADSDGREGAFFVWTPAEIRAVLNPGMANAILAFYDVTDAGNFAGTTILHAPRPLTTVAAELDGDPERLRFILSEGRRALYERRATRVPPLTDTKIVTGWNGLMISAFARAGALLHEASYVTRARAAADFALANLRTNGRLRRAWAAGAARGDAFLEDYADLAAGLVDLYDATSDVHWLTDALALHATLEERFWDGERGGFYSTADDAEETLVRAKPDDDLPLPSGNAVAAETLLRLAELTGDERLRRRAEDTVRALATTVAGAPTRAPRLLGVIDFLLDRPREIVIVHPPPPEDPRLVGAVRARYLPNRVLVVARPNDRAAQEAVIPLLRDKEALGGRSTAYVCTRGVCELPTSDLAVLERQLAQVAPFPSE